MRFITRTNVELLHKSESLSYLEEIVGQKMSWPKVETKISYRFEYKGKGGKTYEVGNGKKFLDDIVIVQVQRHYSLYKILS